MNDYTSIDVCLHRSTSDSSKTKHSFLAVVSAKIQLLSSSFVLPQSFWVCCACIDNNRAMHNLRTLPHSCGHESFKTYAYYLNQSNV